MSKIENDLRLAAEHCSIEPYAKLFGEAADEIARLSRNAEDLADRLVQQPMSRWTGPCRHCGADQVALGMCRNCGVSQHSLNCATLLGKDCDCAHGQLDGQ